MTADYWTAFWQGVGAATSVFVVLVAVIAWAFTGGYETAKKEFTAGRTESK